MWIQSELNISYVHRTLFLPYVFIFNLFFLLFLVNPKAVLPYSFFFLPPLLFKRKANKKNRISWSCPNILWCETKPHLCDEAENPTEEADELRKSKTDSALKKSNKNTTGWGWGWGQSRILLQTEHFGRQETSHKPCCFSWTSEGRRRLFPEQGTQAASLSSSTRQHADLRSHIPFRGPPPSSPSGWHTHRTPVSIWLADSSAG